MRWTEFFIPTTKEIPKDATVASHQLMIRAGLIRQLAAGIYSYLPLGYRTLRKVEAIVRDEMNRAGAIELHLPVLHPIELWRETGRVAAMGDVLLRLRPVKDRDESDWRAQTVLGPTHEEPITEIARAYLNSYKLLPVNLYQIQVKFRGEARPKSGVLRTREFLMKDAYSFHRDVDSLNEGYKRMYDAYCRIFGRCGLPYIAVEAESGPIGGDASHEFMVLTDAGEDFVAISENGDYAANTERATRAVKGATAQGGAGAAPSPSKGEGGGGLASPLTKIHTPGVPGIDGVCELLKIQPAQMIKTLVYRATSTAAAGGKNSSKSGETAESIIVCVRGDHEVNEGKLRRLLPGCTVEMPTPDAAIAEGFAIGYVGPHIVRQKPCRLIIDPDAFAVRDAVTGANEKDHHVRGFDWQREVGPELLAKATLADVRNVVDGDLSPTGSGSPLRLRKAIEIGHVFKLGTKYSDAMKATFLDQDGKPRPLIMGCYGIGLNRIMAAAIEAHHDENGICWPMSIAPFEALIVALDPREKDVMETAGRIHDELAAAGVDVLLDDRDERAGFKFKDADLIGIPLRITIGRKGLAEGIVELKPRDSAEIEKLAPGATASRAAGIVAQARTATNK